MNTALSPVVFKLKGNSYMLEYDYSVILLGIAKQASTLEAKHVSAQRMGHIRSLGICPFEGGRGGDVVISLQ